MGAPGGHDASSLRVAEQYVGAFRELAVLGAQLGTCALELGISDAQFDGQAGTLLRALRPPRLLSPIRTHSRDSSLRCVG